MEHKEFRIRIPWPTIRLSQAWRRWLPTPGNIVFTVLIVAMFFMAQSAGALPLGRPQTAPAAASTGTIAYQGRLADAAGAPLTGTYNMIFRLYDAATGGTPLWSEQWTGSNGVRVSDGLFNVMLGSLTAMPQAVIAGHDQLFLGITVGTDDEMLPRVQLGSVPFAVQALTVPDGSVTTAKIADGAVTQAKLGVDVSLVPPDGSITTAKLNDSSVTTAKLADGAVTASKLGEQPYYFHGALATPSEWMADVVFNANYARFCQTIERTFVRAEELQGHYHSQRGNGWFYPGWYYVGRRYYVSDTAIWGNGDPNNEYNVWQYNGNGGVSIDAWTVERSAIIWCR